MRERLQTLGLLPLALLSFTATLMMALGAPPHGTTWLIWLGFVPLTLVAGLGHASLGSVDWALLAQLLAGSLPGIWLGSRLVSRTPERLIRSALSLLLAWAGAKLVLI